MRLHVCENHKKTPALVYGECVGCELEGLRADIKRLKAESKQILNDAVANLDRKANRIAMLESALKPAYVEPAADGRDLVMTEPVREYVFTLRDTRKRLTEMVDAAYIAGWMAGYHTGGTLEDESETNLDWHCGEDWVEDGLRTELLKIIGTV